MKIGKSFGFGVWSSNNIIKYKCEPVAILTCMYDLARFVEYLLIFNNISYITYFNTQWAKISKKSAYTVCLKI